MNSTLTPDGADELSMEARLVHSLFARHGVAKHRRSGYVGELFGLSRAAAYRRVHGSAAWTLEELERLAGNFGETLVDLFGTRGTMDGTLAVLQLAQGSSTCRIWLDMGSKPKADDLFQAITQQGQYVVLPASDVHANEPLRVLKLVVDQARIHEHRIAVLDDQRDVTDAICQQLRREGFLVTPYYDPKTLEPDIAEEKFDGYVLDWLLPGGNAKPLIAQIRAQLRHSAIVILTGEARDGSINEQGVTEATSSYGVHMCEKPARVSHIVNALRAGGLSPASAAADR